MDFKKVVGNIKQKGQEIQKGIGNITSYYTAFDYIKSANNIGIIGHDHIDGDSLGSVLAMQKWLENKFLDKKIKTYTNKKPSSNFDFLEAKIEYGEDLKIEENTDLLIILDCANLERLGDLYKNNQELIDKVNKINIDHHISNDEFGNINIVDSNSPATAQIVYTFFTKLETKVNNLINSTSNGIDKKVADYLLFGILTDTQIFSIPKADNRTLEIAADLIKKGADKTELIDNFYQNKTLERFKLESEILSRTEIIDEKGVKFAYSYIQESDIEKYGIEKGDFSKKEVVSKLREITGIDFVCIAQIDEGKVGISFRSKKYDVQALAEKFKGGGHTNAAAAVINEKLTPDQIKERIANTIFA